MRLVPLKALALILEENTVQFDGMTVIDFASREPVGPQIFYQRVIEDFLLNQGIEYYINHRTVVCDTDESAMILYIAFKG